MKRSSEPGKFYYDVTIEHDPEHADKKHFIKSKAEKTINLEFPLMENPGDYNISVSKFAINTETLPVMIPEITKEQQLADISENKCFETSYWIELTLNYKCRWKTGKDPNNGADIYSNWVENLTVTKKAFVKIPFNYDDENLQKINWKNIERGYIDNTDDQCFIYNYSTFIEALNTCTKKITDEMQEYRLENGEKPFNVFCISENRKSFLAFKLENDRIRYQIHNYIKYYNNGNRCSINSFEIKFSNNLYRYIGNGFNTKFNEDGTWEYVNDNFEMLINQTKTGMFGEAVSYHVNYLQDYPTLTNWNPLKAIVIGSDTIPAVGEFLPISQYDGWLNHTNTKEYRDFLTSNGYNFHNSDDDIFKKNTMCILDIYYPFLSTPGDIRSTCVFSRNNINDGQSIELVDSKPLTTFNIWIKWVDTYGNLHDLYLLPGCSCDLRFCFVKKALLKEDFNEGIGMVVEALAPPEEKKKKRTKSNGKPDGIVLDGADNYGWIHL